MSGKTAQIIDDESSDGSVQQVEHRTYDGDARHRVRGGATAKKSPCPLCNKLFVEGTPLTEHANKCAENSTRETRRTPGRSKDGAGPASVREQVTALADRRSSGGDRSNKHGGSKNKYHPEYDFELMADEEYARKLQEKEDAEAARRGEDAEDDGDGNNSDYFVHPTNQGGGDGNDKSSKKRNRASPARTKIPPAAKNKKKKKKKKNDDDDDDDDDDNDDGDDDDDDDDNEEDEDYDDVDDGDSKAKRAARRRAKRSEERGEGKKRKNDSIGVGEGDDEKKSGGKRQKEPTATRDGDGDNDDDVVIKVVESKTGKNGDDGDATEGFAHNSVAATVKKTGTGAARTTRNSRGAITAVAAGAATEQKITKYTTRRSGKQKYDAGNNSTDRDGDDEGLDGVAKDKEAAKTVDGSSHRHSLNVVFAEDLLPPRRSFACLMRIAYLPPHHDVEFDELFLAPLQRREAVAVKK